MGTSQGMCLFSGLCMCLGFVFAAQVSLVVNVSRVRLHRPALSGPAAATAGPGAAPLQCACLPLQPVWPAEPDSNKGRSSFARRTYSVSFPMFSKIAVTGTGAHPAFKYLTGESLSWLGSRSTLWLAG